MTKPNLPEFELLTACCRWPATAERREAICAASRNVSDWVLFTKLAKRHRVIGLVNNAISDAGLSPPAEAMEFLSQQTLKVVQQNLLLATEAMRIQEALDAAGIPNLSIKGTSLAIIAYNSLSIKQAWDIDVLLDPNNVMEAYDILRANGYELQSQKMMSRDEFATIIPLTKECVLFDESRNIFVELHWRLSDNPNLLSHIKASGPSSYVQVGKKYLRTLEEADLFVYLCVHGTSHGWSRLKWLADVNAMIASKSPEALNGLHREASNRGAGQATYTSMALCQKIFRMDIPSNIINDGKNNLRSKILINMSEFCMKSRSIEENGISGFANFYNRISHLLLGDGSSYILNEFYRMYAGGGSDKLEARNSVARKIFYPLIRVYLVFSRQIIKGK